MRSVWLSGRIASTARSQWRDRAGFTPASSVRRRLSGNDLATDVHGHVERLLEQSARQLAILLRSAGVVAPQIPHGSSDAKA